jgi:L-histidine N-alpha-methyltransferase
MVEDCSTRCRQIVLSAGDPLTEFGREVTAGLTVSPKRLSCRFFYDAEGSALFEAICELPEYYLTRAESAILRSHAGDIAACFLGDVTLIELGSGNAIKTRLLLQAFLRGRSQLRYVPIDICQPVLQASAAKLLHEFPGLEIVAVAAEYRQGLQQLHAEGDRPKLILWLGSNIGNFERPEAARFLSQVRATMTAADRLLVGVDLRKDKLVLESAYDDAAGVTAAFNLNLLARINRELDGTFDLHAFQHRAVYEEIEGRVEMYLVSTREQRVRIGQLGLEVSFAAGELLHTENSYKYSPEEIAELCAASTLTAEHCYFDAERKFCLCLLRKALQ